MPNGVTADNYRSKQSNITNTISDGESAKEIGQGLISEDLSRDSFNFTIVEFSIKNEQ